jgi:hypothetical protein
MHLGKLSHAILTIQEEATDHPDSGDFVLGLLLGMIIGGRAPKAATAYLTAYVDVSDAEVRTTLSGMAASVLEFAGGDAEPPADARPGSKP